MGHVRDEAAVLGGGDVGAERLQRLPGEPRHVFGGAQRPAHRLDLRLDLAQVETGLGVLGDGLGLAFGTVPPALLDLGRLIPLVVEDVRLGEVEVEGGLTGLRFEDLLEQRVHDRVGPLGDGDRHSGGLPDLPALLQQHVQDDGVDDIVRAVQGDRPDDRLLLSEAVDAAFALLVPGRVPRQVVVHDRLEAVLEVDAFGKAVGRHQDPGTGRGGEGGDPLDPRLRRKLPGDRVHGNALLEGVRQVRLEILGRRDVTAEHDRVVSVGDQGSYLLDQLGQFEVMARPVELGEGIGEPAQPRPVLLGQRVVVGGGRRVHAFEWLFFDVVEHRDPAQRVGLGFGDGTAAAVEKGGGGGGGRGGHRAEQAEGRPPPRALCEAAVGCADRLAGVGQDLTGEPAVLRLERVGDVHELAPVGKRGPLVEELADVMAPTLDEEAGQFAPSPGGAQVETRQGRFEQPDEVAERLLLAAVRSRGHQHQVTPLVLGEPLEQLMAQLPVAAAAPHAGVGLVHDDEVGRGGDEQVPAGLALDEVGGDYGHRVVLEEFSVSRLAAL